MASVEIPDNHQEWKELVVDLKISPSGKSAIWLQSWGGDNMFSVDWIQFLQ